MTCDGVLELAIGFVEETLPREARTAMVGHLEGCDDCRGLIASLRDAPLEDPQLTATILQRTTGPACDGVRRRLCAWDDASLDPAGAGLVSGHLERCPECAALGRALSAMRSELPRLSDVDPGRDFVTAVLARTSAKPRRAPLAERWSASVRHLLDRPRIALEGGLVAAMLLVLPFGGLHGGGAPADAVDAVRQASGATSARLSILARAAWGTTRGIVAEHAAGIAAGIERIGTFSAAGASSQASDGTDEIDRGPGTAQERRR